MKQLLILSGKGGTGKTTVASAFIKLAEAKAFADCDVDAPNLHLVMAQANAPVTSDYVGMPKAVVDAEKCTACGACATHCRFDAITMADSARVNGFACEGCGVCEAVCPASALSLEPSVDGQLMRYDGADSVFSTAQLKMGSGTSGLLVTEVKKQMTEHAGDASIAIIDGSPGIGCPVIASLSGVDMVLVVAEPSVSGIHDMARIVKTAKIFKTPAVICINKYDTNPAQTARIEAYCQEHGLAMAGYIPFDGVAMAAINGGYTIVEVDCPAGRAVRDVYDKTMQFLLAQA